MQQLIVACILFFALNPIVYGNNVFIDNSVASCDDQTGRPFCSISAAITHANENDTHLIAAGIYRESINVNKSLKLIGHTAKNTVVDGLFLNTGFIIEPGVRASISNITIRNGKGNKGGGVFNQGSLMLDQCIIENNIALTSGGGIYP